ncbi:TatD family hydrolase [Propionibacteriaceae bacterium Y2011]|uniref:TatD family hydrolase n=1 Tax=Microlunatus sp. Y2014 TaxID=3418488 RepID=UPI003B4A0C0A
MAKLTREERRTLPAAPEPLPVAVTDSHCHLDVADELTGLSPADALARARAVNITRIVQVGCDVASSRWAVELAAAEPTVVAAVALHPNDAARLGDALPAHLAMIEELITGHDRVRAVGETGIDHYRTTDPAGHRLQADSFAAHIAWAKAYDKTLVVHDRDAHEVLADILDAEGWPERVVMHCFSGDAAFARRCLDHGAFLSFPGTVTFPANTDLQEACRITPLGSLLTETDAPFLTPAPHRGRPNASYLIPHTARFIAELRGADLVEVCTALGENADRAFGSW